MSLNVLQVDPYLRIGEDLQLYVRLQLDLGSYGSESDQEVAKSILSDCRTKVGINDQRVLDVIASALSSFTEVSLVCEWCDFPNFPYVYCWVLVLMRLHAIENKVKCTISSSFFSLLAIFNGICVTRWTGMY